MTGEHGVLGDCYSSDRNFLVQNNLLNRYFSWLITQTPLSEMSTQERKTRQTAKSQKKKDHKSAHTMLTQWNHQKTSKMKRCDGLSVCVLRNRISKRDLRINLILSRSLSRQWVKALNRISNTEKHISSLEDQANTDGATVKQLSKDVKLLHERLIDLESRGRRNNIRLTGLKEGAEAGDLNKILRYILDLEDSDRAHRTLRPKPNPGEPPQTIIVHLLWWGDRQIILQASRKKQTLLWEGQRFFVRQDLAMEVQKQSAAYKDIIDKVKTTGLRFGLLHPAKFVITIERKTFKYESLEATLLDLNDKLPDVFWFGRLFPSLQWVTFIQTVSDLVFLAFFVPPAYALSLNPFYGPSFKSGVKTVELVALHGIILPLNGL